MQMECVEQGAVWSQCKQARTRNLLKKFYLGLKGIKVIGSDRCWKVIWKEHECKDQGRDFWCVVKKRIGCMERI